MANFSRAAFASLLLSAFSGFGQTVPPPATPDELKYSVSC